MKTQAIHVCSCVAQTYNLPAEKVWSFSYHSLRTVWIPFSSSVRAKNMTIISTMIFPLFPFFFGQNVQLKPFCTNFKAGNYWAVFFVIGLFLWLAVWPLESESWARLHRCLWMSVVLWTEYISTRCFISGCSWEVSFTSWRIFQSMVVGWDRLKIKERLSAYKETISISRLANTAGKGGQECLAGNPFIRLKDNLPHKLDFIFPMLSVSPRSLPRSLQQMISH